MKTPRLVRVGTAGAKAPADWQPRHVPGPIDRISREGWTLDPDRPLQDLALARLRAGRDRALAVRTLQTYDAVAGAFIRWIEHPPADPTGVESRTPHPAVVADLTPETVFAFLHRRSARSQGPLSLGAQRSEAGTLAGLAAFGNEIGAVAPGALRDFQAPRPVKDAVPTTLTDAEIRGLLAALQRDRSFAGWRLHLWCRLGLDAGARPEEQVAVRLQDIDQAARSITLLGKGGKVRTVYYGEGTAAVLAQYLRFRGDAPVPELFVGRQGAMSAGSFGHAFAALAAQLGLATRGVRRPTQYILRRTFARRFADNGGAVEELARLMGHEETSLPMLLTTYYRPSDERLARAHRRVRPLDALEAPAA